MKFKISKDLLFSNVQIVQNIVSSKATLPILSNILMETKKDKVRFSTTDLNIGITCELPVKTIEEGSITIPAKRFSDIIKELPNGEVTIYAKKNNQIDIEGEKCRFKLVGLPKEEFPKFPEFDNKENIRIDQKVFKKMLKLTSFAVSHEESRYILNGVLIEVEDDLIRLVATDGRRLAKIESNLIVKVKKLLNVILPTKAIQEINRNLTEEGEVSITIGKNQILFDINNVLIATRIIEGEFPNYKQVIPKESPIKINIKTESLLSAIRRANLLTTPDFQVVKFEVFKDKLIISKSTPDVGESREEIGINYKGNEFIIGFNPQYLIDFLKNIEEDIIDLELLGVNEPAVIRIDKYIYLTLPMRI